MFQCLIDVNLKIILKIYFKYLPFDLTFLIFNHIFTKK